MFRVNVLVGLVVYIFVVVCGASTNPIGVKESGSSKASRRSASVIIKDSSKKSSKGITLKLPTNLRGLKSFGASQINAAAKGFLTQLGSDPTIKVRLPSLHRKGPRRSVFVDAFERLLNDKFLDDEIISEYFKQLHRFAPRHSNIIIVDPICLEKDLPKAFTFEDGRVYVWPLNHREERHWTLLVITPSKVGITLENYNPLISIESKTGLDKAVEIIQARRKEDITILTPPMPQYQDGVSCGVLICEFGKTIVLGRPTPSPTIKWVPLGLRNRMAFELVTGRLFQSELLAG